MATAKTAGVDLAVAELVRLRGEAARLRLPDADRSGGPLPDLYHSLHRGRGLDFEEVRAYQPGDDFRSVDWRVTARTGRLHTKVFLEEREHALLVAVDAGPTMRFGSRVAFKWVAAARAAAVLAWLAVENGDRVGGLVFGEAEPMRARPPEAGAAGAVTLFKLLATTAPLPPGDRPALPAPPLKRLGQIAHHGAVVAVFSDFLGWGHEAETALTALAARNDVALVLVHDPLEAALPPAGRYVFHGEGAAMVVDTGEPELRAAHAKAFADRADRVAAACRRVGARFSTLATDRPPAQALRDGILRRRRRG